MEAITFSIEVVIRVIVKTVKAKIKSFKTKKIVGKIAQQFKGMKSCQFVGIKEYTSTTTGEVANHVVLTNFKYGNAVKKDLKKLRTAKESDIKAIAAKGFPESLVEQAIEKLATSFENNMNKETASNQSKAQSDIYVKVNNAMKIHKETKQLYIYAMAISKQILVEGERKHVNSSQLTLCQNAVKKYFDFSTAKYRNFVVSPETLSGVNLNGESFELI